MTPIHASALSLGDPTLNTSDSEQDRWFVEQVLPHEPALRSYLQIRFPSLPDKDDVIQEAYTRVIREHRTGEVRFPRSFLIITARNVALDALRRQGRTPTEEITNVTEGTLLEHQPNAADNLLKRQELEILADAVADLPDRCRDVVILRYLEGLSYKEIAARLGISHETVKMHLTKGLRRCVEFFETRG